MPLTHQLRTQAADPPANGNQGPEARNNGSGAFASQHYRSLFQEAGHSEQETSAKLQSAFQHLFHGGPATQAVFFPAGRNANGPLAYLTDLGQS
ncbi:MAG: hypothetical protein JO028_19145 [Acidobacteriaceae bacterium]|nr:hypothetical protein [Acidobacteriaceae bacterium]